ncbi:MAG TPA: hypothetical protein VNK46_13925 [Nitrospiraceae bacterium]|nr:hypothetical protein [Nitrospiraceae bacterium]
MTLFSPSGYNRFSSDGTVGARAGGPVLAMVGETAVEKSGRIEEQGLLFEYTIRLALLAGLLELVLYRLVSRLGMHLSKVFAQHESVRLIFKALSSIGFALLNTVSLLVFLALLVLLANKIAGKRWVAGIDKFTVPAVMLVLLLTIGFLIVPPAMFGSVVYNLVAFAVITLLTAEYLLSHQSPSRLAFGLCFFLGISGWFYYQTLSTGFGWLGILTPPPLVHEINRAGEALMVLASILVFWAYGGGVSFHTKNRRLRRRALWFWSVACTLFAALLFMDYALSLYNPAVAETVRKAGEGISWIFQMGMGYTFYLPFAFYVTGLLCWSYAVIKLLFMGRMAGYGLGFLFIAGYALQLSHLTLMVILGLMLLNLDKRRVVAMDENPATESRLATAPPALVSGRT